MTATDRVAAPWIRGKVVLVTGAASGIGAEVALELHRLGARLLLTDVDESGLLHSVARLAPDALSLPVDVARIDDLHAAVDAAVRCFGSLDVVWANAGIGTLGPLALTDPAAWARTVDVNLVGAFNTVHAALPQIIRNRGHVAVTASVASFVNVPGMSAYCASKAGLEAMCNALRIEVAHHGVTVGAIHPSWVATPMVAAGDSREMFRRLRAALPTAMRSDMPLAGAARRMAHCIAERRERAYLPGFVRLIRWLRTPLHTALGERALRSAAPGIEEAFMRQVVDEGVRRASWLSSPGT